MLVSVYRWAGIFVGAGGRRTRRAGLFVWDGWVYGSGIGAGQMTR